jgi:hypothetical protein
LFRCLSRISSAIAAEERTSHGPPYPAQPSRAPRPARSGKTAAVIIDPRET